MFNFNKINSTNDISRIVDSMYFDSYDYNLDIDEVKYNYLNKKSLNELLELAWEKHFKSIDKKSRKAMIVILIHRDDTSHNFNINKMSNKELCFYFLLKSEFRDDVEGLRYHLMQIISRYSL